MPHTTRNTTSVINSTPKKDVNIIIIDLLLGVFGSAWPGDARSRRPAKGP
jgi:hypothetical protein